MTNKERKHFTPEEKVSILRRHLVDKVPVSDLCEEADTDIVAKQPLAGTILHGVVQLRVRRQTSQMDSQTLWR